MEVVCRKTNGNAELHCCVCGQGFVLFWDRQTASERIAARREIQESLRRQHGRSSGCEVHPEGSFMVPEWTASVFHTVLAIPGKAPVWEL